MSARVLKISRNPVTQELKKNSQLQFVCLNNLYNRQVQPKSMSAVCRVQETEMDEMWSFVQSKQQQWWLWHPINHASGKILALCTCPS